MYKAILSDTSEEIIILDDIWEDDLDHLRILDHQDKLLCQGCRQPVRVKAGAQRLRSPHFAHKHLMGCSYGSESPKLLAARAALYRWLSSKFKTGVSIEKQVDTPLLPRPIDCVVDYEGIIYAFWIFDAGMKQHIRTAIKSYFMRQDIQVNWIFVVDMLQPALIYKNNILLSTTERFFLERSRYDGLEPPFSLQNINDERGLTLHYINPSTKELISYRSLNMVHAPNEYHGQRICNPLSEVDIDFDTGDLAHPGEHESLIFYENKIAELKQREMDILLARQNKDKMVEMAIQERRSLSRPKDIDLPDEPAKKAEYPCIYCGSLTSNWWTVFMHEGKKMCKCCECEEKGITQ